jgi:general secretion pathway protein B
LVKARDEMENATLEEHSVPLLSSLSQSTKDSVPTVYYQRHDYSGNRGQSSVVLNGKPLKVGGSPISGMKVDEILPDSVVLSYRGTQFRLRALNSWINL